MADLTMIVGLGNPGPKYARNRHNIGFQCVDLLARRHQIQLSRLQLKARIGDGWIRRRIDWGQPRSWERRKVLLVKPLTYMNASGEAVAPLVRYYQVTPENILVVHDDLDMASGKLRLRAGGSSGGQNGIRSIIHHLGSQDFARVKVGIGRPPGRMDPAAYVLQDFSPDEEEIFAPLRERICDAVECWLFEGIDTAMNRYNG